MKEGTQVFKYLSHLVTYLNGDLENFHKMCEEIEMEERKSEILETEITKSFDDSETTKPVGISSKFSNYGVSGFDGSRSKNIPPYYRSTTPHTLLLFSTIDILGYLIRPDGNERQTTKNFEEFFKGTLSDIFLDFLIVVVRHGVTHSFFPKLDVGISYHSTNLDKDLFFKENNGVIIINVNILEKLVIEKVDDIFENGDYSNMENQYNKMISNYEEGVRGKIEQLRSLL